IRILVLRGGAIGDFIVTLPALRKLRDRWPQAHIELVGYPHVALLAHAAGLVDHVESLDKAEIARFFAARPCFTEAQRDYLRSFHFVITYLHDPDGTVRENFRAAGAQQVLYGSPLITAGHAVEALLKPLETLALYAEEHEHPCLALNAEQLAWGRDWLAAHGLGGQKLLAIHPGSGSPHKNWPLENFIAVVRQLPRGVMPLLVLGEADDELAAPLARELPEVPRLTGCSLLEVASVLAHCAAYLGNDSGITHLAAALGLPVVALFGPSPVEHWAPRGPRVFLLQAPDGKTAELKTADVAAAVFQALPAVSGVERENPH
ncbi:MAG: glycosyltransferase family 9 protein, partial [Kiritimatiellaeota bacterium]|nr:glycosyltransferase family 9 protein [Kiritimatiellota bacterium]